MVETFSVLWSSISILLFVFNMYSYNSVFFRANALSGCMCRTKVAVQDRDICASFKSFISLKRMFVQAKFSEMHEGPC